MKTKSQTKLESSNKNIQHKTKVDENFSSTFQPAFLQQTPTSFQKVEERQRNFGLDILRNLSVFLIVLYHFLHHGVFLENAIGANWYIENILHCIFLVAVNVFVLISGYFLSFSEKPFKLKKFLNLLFQASFYSTIIYLFFCCVGYEQFTLFGLYQNVFTFLTNRYWFLTTYLIMYLASPFLNMIVKNISKKQFAFLLCGILFLCLLTGNFGMSGTLYLSNGFSVFWFVLLYLIAGGIRKFDLFKIKNWILIVTYFVALIFLICQKIFPEFAQSDVVKYIFNIRITYDSFFVLICSVALFTLFSRIGQTTNKKLSNFIKVLASTGFGVYLLHDNNLVRSKIYGDWFAVQRFYTNQFATLHIIIFSIVTYIFCVFIDLLRQQLDKLCRKIITTIKRKRANKKKLDLLS